MIQPMTSKESGMLSKNILATITYYDGMNYPLTAFEVWSLMLAIGAESQGCSLKETIFELEKGQISKFITQDRGFYFLRDRKGLVDERLERNKISDQKLRLTLKAVRFLRFIPFLKMVAVAGRVAMKNSVSGSDLDLLLVFEKGHLFTGRFLSLSVLAMLGMRRHGDLVKDRICSNHFLSDSFEVSVKDIFSSHEYVFLLPVFGFESYAVFLEKNKDWLSRYRPNFENSVPGPREVKDIYFSRSVRHIGEILFSPSSIERRFKKWQTDKIERNPKTDTPGGIIIYTDDELAFWPEFEKQGPRIFEKFQKRLSELGNRPSQS